MRATQTTTAEFKKGQRFVINSPGHQYHSYSGTLQFSRDSKAWLQIGPELCVLIPLECLVRSIPLGVA